MDTLFAAHIRKDDIEQSVYQHLENVGEYCSLYAEKIGLSDCGRLTGHIHDMAKLTVKFDTYLRKSHANPDKKMKGPDHSTAGAIWVLSLLGENASEIDRLTAQIIAMAAMWHHGGLKNVYDELGYSDYLKRLNKKKDQQWQGEYIKITAAFETHFPRSEMQHLFQNAVKEIERLLAKITEGQIRKHDLRYAFGLICKYLYSCLIDADRYDTATFMDGRQMQPPADNQKIWERLSEIVEQKMKQLDAKKEINSLRHQLSDACFQNADLNPGVYQLNSPTGAGKTLSGLRYAIHHARKYKKDRIFYIVPLISIIDQNSKAIKEFLSEEEGDRFTDSLILELHSAKEEDITDENELKEAELLAERMDAPIVITTMVRFLNTFFKGGTRNPRAVHNFANAVIIFDEIQTLPVKCIGMYNSLINFLTTVCNTTVVLSTATQPGLEHVPEKIPALEMKQQELSGCTEKIRGMFRRTEFDLELLPSAGEPDNTLEDVTEKMISCLERNNHILGVFNTKSSARKVYQALQATGPLGAELYFLSTSLCPAHRKDKLKSITEKMETDQKIIVISTQLIEAGVDLDFDVVFRALAGLDSLIQAAGRCNRHAKRPVGQGYLFRPDFENLTNLISIQNGRDSMLKLLNRFRKHPEEFDHRLDSLEAIRFYYTDYFAREKGNMLYPFEVAGAGRAQMYTLLNDNRAWADAARKNGTRCGYRIWEPILFQSFGLAGKYFEPIERSGRSVVVPYGKGTEIISALLSSGGYGEKVRLLRHAQQYSINITEGMFRKIKDGIHFHEELGAAFLDDAYYDPGDLGLLEEPQQDVLIIDM